mmetsp:Transcript_28005/g.41270  ORF Transcript_28005/g.41270 Transcript_28005/m.41270 type:complete len:822 (-) Transcript_28005:88-2553(-)
MAASHYNVGPASSPVIQRLRRRLHTPFRLLQSIHVHVIFTTLLAALIIIEPWCIAAISLTNNTSRTIRVRTTTNVNVNTIDTSTTTRAIRRPLFTASGSNNVNATTTTTTQMITTLNLQDMGAIPNDTQRETLSNNAYILQYALSYNIINKNNNNRSNEQEDEYESYLHVIVPNSGTFYLDRGVYVDGLQNAIIEINGRLSFRFGEIINEFISRDHRPTSCLTILNSKNVTITSSKGKGSTGTGIMDGGGPKWWGVPYLGYVQRLEDRPYLLLVNHTENMVISNLLFQDAPYYTMKLSNVNNLEIYGISIVNRRTREPSHSFWDLSAFNTDGIDVDGHNVYVHDVDIWNQDDCIAVKDHHGGGMDRVSSNMTFERIHASGLGLVIGSIGGSTVRNITFRDSYLHKTVKGIYMKFRSDLEAGRIEDIKFENITIESPMQWPIWIGPAQQVAGGSSNICSSNPCSLCWPYVPFTKCDAGYHSTFRNIMLKDIRINNPRQSAGVIMGGEGNVIDGLVMDSVVVQQTRRSALRDGDDHDLNHLFPGLQKASLHDKYVQDGRTILTVIIIVTIVFVIGIMGFCARAYSSKQCKMAKSDAEKNELLLTNHAARHRQRTWSEEKKKHPVAMKLGLHRSSGKQEHVNGCCLSKVLLIACMIIGAFLIYYLVVTRRVHDLSHYYKCEHVNGRAIGSTWPVPSCLLDETSTAAAAGKHKLKNREAIKQTWIVAVILLSLSSPFCFKFAMRMLTGAQLLFFKSLYTPTPVYKLTVLEEEEEEEETGVTAGTDELESLDDSGSSVEKEFLHWDGSALEHSKQCMGITSMVESS